MNTLQAGDLLLLQADTVDETVEWIKNYVARLTEKKQADLDAEPIPDADPTIADQDTHQSANINSVHANSPAVMKQ